MTKEKKTVYGVGVSDLDYKAHEFVNGVHAICAFYETWKGMLRRCYDEKYQKKKLTYVGCSVCEEWLTFSNFKAWMVNQYWRGKQLDKDILIKGNKVYSPETCVFVSALTNSFTTERYSARGQWPLGVTLERKSGKFVAQCCNPFLRKRQKIGRFTSDVDAHLAWKKRKHELACQLAELQSDERVAQALRLRYL